MAKRLSPSGELLLKIAIIGQPDSGKRDIITHVANSYDQSALRTISVSDAEIILAEFILPEPLSDGPFVRVELYAVSGSPLHQATDQLVMSGCDALVFVVGCDPEKTSECKAALRSLTQNAALTGLNLGEVVLVLQYNKADGYPMTTMNDMDSLLGVNIDQVERYHTKVKHPNEQGLAVDAAIRGAVANIGLPSAGKTA